MKGIWLSCDTGVCACIHTRSVWPCFTRDYCFVTKSAAPVCRQRREQVNKRVLTAVTFCWITHTHHGPAPKHQTGFDFKMRTGCSNVVREWPRQPCRRGNGRERERERWDAESPTVRVTHIHRQADIFDSCTDTPERHTDPLCPGEVLIGVTSLT